MDINLKNDNLIRAFSKMIDYLEEDDPMRVDFWDGETKVGYAEFSITEYDNEDAVEIRWIEVEPTMRNKGYLRRIVKGILGIDKIIVGEITEIHLYQVWKNLGADFINNWEWVIYPKRN